MKRNKHFGELFSKVVNKSSFKVKNGNLEEIPKTKLTDLIQQYRQNKYNYPNSKLDFDEHSQKKLLNPAAKPPQKENLPRPRKSSRQKAIQRMLNRHAFLDPLNVFLKTGLYSRDKKKKKKKSVSRFLREDPDDSKMPSLPTFRRLIKKYNLDVDKIKDNPKHKILKAKPKKNFFTSIKLKLRMHTSFLGIYEDKKVVL